MQTTPSQAKSTSVARQRVQAAKHESSTIELLEERLRRLEIEMGPSHNKEVLHAVAEQKAALEQLNSDLIQELQREADLLRQANEQQREYITALESVISEHGLKRVGLSPAEEQPKQPETTIQQFYEAMTGIQVEHRESTEDSRQKFTLKGRSDSGSFACDIWLGEECVDYAPQELNIDQSIPIPDYIRGPIEFHPSQAPIFFFELAKLLLAEVPKQ